MFTSLPTPAHRDQVRSEADGRLPAWPSWRPEMPAPSRVLTVAELAECECPDLCNRDHDND